MMTIFTRASDRQTVSLGKQIADSGEGEVWETNFSGILAKIYHNPTPERIEKLKAMLANPPVDPMKSKNHISIAFPQDLLQDGSGNCVGFLMPAVRGSRELTSIYNPRLRRRNAPGFNWYYLHVTALNTAWIIQAIHEKGYVLGDIKPQNILVNDRALVAVIDTDSFQVCESKTGKVYRCTVGSDGFTPVELLGKDFAVTDQSEVCDRFRLAVLIHYLLFGYHPFSGEWTGAGESPDQTELISKGLWYGGNSSLIRPSQNTIPLDVVHPEIKRLFLKCFNDGHASPKLRPTAEDWYKALQVAVNDLTPCDRIDSHHRDRSYSKCYWCERSAKLGIDIFPGSFVTYSEPITEIARVTYSKPITEIARKIFSAHENLELLERKGQKLTVFGIVSSANHTRIHQSLLINFITSGAKSGQFTSFRIIVYAQGLEKLSRMMLSKVYKPKYWVGKYFQITGLINISTDSAGYRIPHIVLREPEQIKLLSKVEADNLLKIIQHSASSTMYS